MEYTNYVKLGLAALVGLLSSVLGVLCIPVMILIATNVIDYVTGLMAAPYRPRKKGQSAISSYKSIKGITKKVCQWLLVIVGALMDELILYGSTSLGVTIKVKFFIAAVVAVWLTLNEIISILENMLDIGVKIPRFLMPFVKNLQKRVDDLAENELLKGGEQNGSI